MDLEMPVIFIYEEEINSGELPLHLELCFKCAVMRSSQSNKATIKAKTVEMGDDGNDMRSFRCDDCEQLMI